MAQKTYLDKLGLQEFLLKVKEKFAPIEALVFKGTVADIAHLPSLADQKAGYMYNVTKGGETTSDFVEGAGHVLRDGDNVAAINVGTEESPVFKWDVLPGVFKIEDRLQFGFAMPETPEDEQVFLYLGETSYKYSDVTSTLTKDKMPFSRYTSSTPALFESASSIDHVPEDGQVLWSVNEEYLVYDPNEDPDTEVNGYLPSTVSPEAVGLYEESMGRYRLSTDSTPIADKTYFRLFPHNMPVSNSANPSALGLCEGNNVASKTPTSDTSFVNGKQYYYVDQVTPFNSPANNDYLESNGAGGFVKTSDTTVNPSKTYYRDSLVAVMTRGDNPVELGLYESDGADPATYTLTEDTYVRGNKHYFGSPEEEFVEGVIYQYDEAETKWIPKTAGDTYSRITEAEIDEMFENL